MPLIRYEIRNEYSLANPELYRAAPKDDPEALLEAVAMAGLVGIVRQLGDLAEFAAEVFHDLHEEVMATAARSHELVARVQQLEAELPAVEKAQFSENYQLQFAYTQGAEWHASIYIDQNLLTQGDFPWFIRNSYEECRGPPRLFLLDKFDVAGAGACLKRYTDPSFFKTEWASTELLKAEKEKRDKKARKSKKKGRRRRNRELEGTFFTQMYRSMEYSSLNLAPGGASGIVSQCLNSQRRARFPAFGKNAVGDSTQASSSKLKPVYNGHILDSDRQGHLFPVERVPDFRNPEAIKVGVHDTEIETFQLKFARDEQYADLAMKEDSDLCEKPSLDADDDAASDTEQFVDALATIESEVETDTESKPKPDSDSYTQVGEVRRLSMSTSVNNEALQGDAFDVDIPETSDDVEQGSISSTPARINLEHLEKMKMSLSSTSLPENRLSSPLLDKNAFSEQNTLSHSSIEYKLSSYSEGKQSPSMDENGAILLEPTSLSSSINENRILSNGDSSPLYENSLALSFEENRVSSSFDENNLSSGETSISPSSVKIKVLPSSGDTFSSSFDENSGVPIVGDKIESPDRNIKSSSLVKSNHFSVLDENDAVPDFIRQTETGHISPVLEELQKTTSIDGEQDDSSTSFHLLPGPAIPLVNGDQNGKPGSLGSLASHKKVMSNELLIEVASTSSHGTARLGEEETGIVATADEELSSQSAEMNEAAPSTTDSLMYQCRVSEDEDDFDSMMQVSSTASSSSHSLACTPLIGVTGYSIDSDSELKSPVSSQLSLDSSPRSPRFSVLRSPTSPIQMPLDLVPPLELSAHNLYSKFLTPDSPTLSPMRNPAVFCSSASSSSLSSSTPPSPPHSSVVCSVDKAENSYTAQISSILSPMARQETLELPNSPTLAPMATSEAFMMHQSRKNQSLMESSNDVPVSPRSPVLMPMLNAEKLQPHTSSLSRQEESPPVPRSINHTVEKKQQLPAATSMVSNSAFLAEELSIASNGILSYAAAQEKPLALSSIAVTSPKIKRNELQPLRGSPTLQPLVTKEEELPPPPPIPPLQWCVRSDQTGLPLPASKTSEHSVRLRSSSLPTVRISEPPAPPALPMASRRFESIGGKDELIEAIASHNRSSLKKVTNQHRAPIPKTLDEREMLLEQIRTRSFSLRHTTVEKHEAPRSVTSINVAAILEKANAIRQAFVGSDDEEDDDWSDS